MTVMAVTVSMPVSAAAGRGVARCTRDRENEEAHRNQQRSHDMTP
jgi:hypothetical protein